MISQDHFLIRYDRWAQPASAHTLVVLAASAGGLDALVRTLSTLPADFPAAIAVVQHRSAHHPDLLRVLLAARTALRVRDAKDGDLLEPGTVYICPPGLHMTVERCIRLVEGPRLEFVRPSADLMLQSAARAFGEHAIGVVLSGNGKDGSVGCAILSQAGGTVIAQDPASSTCPGMPTSAIAQGRVDLVLPVEQIGEALRRLVDNARSASNPHSPRTPKAAISVLLADDHQIIREGLRTLLKSEHDIEVVAEAENGRMTVKLATELSPDVVVMDISMPDLNGIDATWQIKERNPRTNVVALSARTDVQAASRIVEAGATGYLCKSAAFDELVLAIRTVSEQKPYFTPQLAALIAGHRAQKGKATPLSRLTMREREVLQLMAEGRPSDRIALLLGLTAEGVEAYGKEVMEKLGIDNLAGLTRYAIREGLTSIDL